jgi:hypothetical protein
MTARPCVMGDPGRARVVPIDIHEIVTRAAKSLGVPSEAATEGHVTIDRGAGGGTGQGDAGAAYSSSQGPSSWPNKSCLE